ncbi:hypothetical protein MtrunA17_Chr1g0213601 [Medicago truncatula]|uniref:Uncharacterized protein n=1 Tax=Medicago truncatula TaxID=3880 RepID=A0A396K067_MEDTR|nr:hypothetical protein MtrunA17_Chr1g0213601 [Medicago truncatula]
MVSDNYQKMISDVAVRSMVKGLFFLDRVVCLMGRRMVLNEGGDGVERKKREKS